MKNRSSLALTICILAAALALAGCRRPTVAVEFIETPDRIIPTVIGRHRIVGRSVRNRPIMTQVFGQGPDTILIMATIHGNEPAGTPLVNRLARYLKENPRLISGRTIVLLALANPDGRAEDTRHNANGVDLNRNFEASNRINSATSGRAALSEPEARTIRDLIRKHAPDRIVTIHQPLACIDYDGPAKALAQRMGRYCDLPVRKLGARPGSLGSYAGLTLAIPIITLELRHSDSDIPTATLWKKYAPPLLAAIEYPNPLR